MYKITTADGTFEAPTAEEAIKMALELSERVTRTLPRERGWWPEIPPDTFTPHNTPPPWSSSRNKPDWWTIYSAYADAASNAHLLREATR